MRITKKTVAIALTAVMALSTICASAAWVPAGYDIRDLDNIGKIYNEVINDNYTSNHKIEKLPEESIEWVAEGFELDYPHAGYERLYLEGNAQVVTRYNNLFPQWETKFADYFWELYGDHEIYQRQQSNIPDLGWTWDYGKTADVDATLLVGTNRFADVDVSWEVYGVGYFDLEGNLIEDEDIITMYEDFNVDQHELMPCDDHYDYLADAHYCADPYNFCKHVDPQTKNIVAGFFTPQNLSRLDKATGTFAVTDEEIAEVAPVILTKVLDGPALQGDDGHKVLADEYLRFMPVGGRSWEWDADSLKFGGAEISWTEPTYEIVEPYFMYQYLVINGLVFDGRNDLPRIWRYTGGKYTPDVEWKYAFVDKATTKYPFNVVDQYLQNPYYLEAEPAKFPFAIVEQKYVDGKVAVDENGDPIYRLPTGEYGNYYIEVTPTAILLKLQHGPNDIILAHKIIEHHDDFAVYAPGDYVVVGDDVNGGYVSYDAGDVVINHTK